MTHKEAKAGIRKFLRGDGGSEISIDWFTHSGDRGRETLFEMLDAPGTPLKTQLNIQQLLLTMFYSNEVEQRLLARAASAPDARTRDMKERTVRMLVDGRHALRTRFKDADAGDGLEAEKNT